MMIYGQVQFFISYLNSDVFLQSKLQHFILFSALNLIYVDFSGSKEHAILINDESLPKLENKLCGMI